MLSGYGSMGYMTWLRFLSFRTVHKVGRLTAYWSSTCNYCSRQGVIQLTKQHPANGRVLWRGRHGDGPITAMHLPMWQWQVDLRGQITGHRWSTTEVTVGWLCLQWGAQLSLPRCKLRPQGTRGQEGDQLTLYL